MRVLHVLHTSLPFLCGYSIRSDYIFRFQAQQGMTPGVVTSAQHPNGDARQETVHEIPHWRTPALSGRQLPLLREWNLMAALAEPLERAIAEFRPDLIHAHSPLLVGYPALRAARRHGLPFVYEVRDLWENASVDRGKFKEGSLPYKIARDLETRLLRRADQVVTICENLRAELAPRAGGADRVHVVPNGVDATGFQPLTGSPEVRARWNLQGKRVLAYVGAFQPYEGLEILLKAMPRVAELAPDAHLVIAGGGGLEPELHRLRDELGIRKLVTFTGRLPHAEVDQVYRVADLMVYPRILTRVTALTTPLKPLEAMAMGRAVAVSDVPAMLELVRPGETGISFHSDDPEDLAVRCAAVLRDPAQAASLGTAARRYIEQERDWPLLVTRYQEIYRLAGEAMRARGGAQAAHRTGEAA